MRLPFTTANHLKGRKFPLQLTPKSHRIIRDLVFASVCLALCLVLPFFTGQIPQVGKALCPMHIPVFLAGFLCSPWWAMAVGAAAPVLRSVLFSRPALFPDAVGMTFELLTYGLVAGLLYRLLPKKPSSVYTALICAMVAGRVVWGVASIFTYGAAGTPFTWPLFFAGAFTHALPGIALHILLIPVLVLALQRAKIL